MGAPARPQGASAAEQPPRRPRAPAASTVLAWGSWAVAVAGLLATVWFHRLLRQAGHPELVEAGSEITLVLGSLSAATAGAVLAARRPAHPVGWLLLAFGLLPEALAAAAEAYARYGLLARPGALPAASYVAMFASVSFIPGLSLLAFVLLLTPTGSPPSPRWRWWAWATVVPPVAFTAAWLRGTPTIDPEPPWQAIPNPLAVPALAEPLLGVSGQAAQAVALTVVVAAVSLVLRFRRAAGVERQQLRWLAFAAALAPVAVLVTAAGIVSGHPAVANWSAGLYLALLPLTIVAAIARYRLYDLDRLISRTLAYSLLTLLLGLGYAAIALGLGQLLGRRSSLAVAAATLAVAGAFQPVRRALQQVMDRRFDRRRYDAARTIDAFSARLRQQVDLDTLVTELLSVVGQTIQPTSASLWLRPGAGNADDRAVR